MAADQIALTVDADREFLLNELGKLADIELGAPPQAPFVLLRALGPDPVGVHERLRLAGWAVRRADTFPGLGAGWLRIAVCDRITAEAFAAALDHAVHLTENPAAPPAAATPAARTIDLRDSQVPQYSDRQDLP
jgi:histidinol-phosphate aminotransferase